MMMTSSMRTMISLVEEFSPNGALCRTTWHNNSAASLTRLAWQWLMQTKETMPGGTLGHLSRESVGAAGGWPLGSIAWLGQTRCLVQRPLVRELQVRVTPLPAYGHQFTTVPQPLQLLGILVREAVQGPLPGLVHVPCQGAKLSSHPKAVKSPTTKATQKMRTQVFRCLGCRRCLMLP